MTLSGKVCVPCGPGCYKLRDRHLALEAKSMYLARRSAYPGGNSRRKQNQKKHQAGQPKSNLGFKGVRKKNDFWGLKRKQMVDC